MRILCPNYSPIEDNCLLSGLRRLGNEVRICNLQAMAPGERASTWRQAWRAFRPDLVLNFGYWQGRFRLADLDPPPGSSRVPFVYWACGGPLFLEISAFPMAAKADLILTTAEECIPIYRRRGCRAGFLQHGCNPELMRRVSPAETHQFVLIANNYSQPGANHFRLRGTMDILAPLIAAGYEVKVWGQWWTEPSQTYRLPPGLYGGPLAYERLAGIYGGAAIVLGLQCHNLSRTQTSCRVFEVLGCGAFYLGPDTKGSRTYFVPGKHLVLSGSPRETLSLARYYLAHPEERARIAAAGQLEVYRKHTALHRAREFIEQVEGL